MIPMMLLGFAKKAVFKTAAAHSNKAGHNTLNPGSGTSKATKKYYILNFIRLLNILSLLASGISTGSLLAKSSSLKISIFNAFDAAEKILLLIIILFLLATEIPKLSRASYISKNWPLFSHSAGFTTLAFAMVFVGADVLSYLTKKGTDKKSLGADWYRLCLAAGVMTLVVAAADLLATLLGADRARGMSARQVRAGKNGAGAGVGVGGNSSAGRGAGDVESAVRNAVPRKPTGAQPPQRARMV